jgi:hypothetical protein
MLCCILKMEVPSSSKTVVIIYQTMWCHIPEDNLYSHCCENIRSHICLKGFLVWRTFWWNTRTKWLMCLLV